MTDLNGGLERRRLTVWQLSGYGVGEAASSLVLNGLFGFALIFYTEALGLSPALAGLALSVSVFWEALTEPAMGFISDRVRTRWGRRLPWIAVGAIAMAVSFVALWHVPQMFLGSQAATFGYLLAANIALRTALTIFVVPYLALGFEIAITPEERSRLQSVRWVFNMIANLLGPGLAWLIFFPTSNKPGSTGGQEMHVVGNYQSMGIWFAAAILVLTGILIWACRRSASMGEPRRVSHLNFLSTYRVVISDRPTLVILGALLLFVISMVLVSSIQTYVYVEFMHLTSRSKTIAASSGMIGAAVGSLCGPIIAHRFGKPDTLAIGCLVGITSQALSAIFFLSNSIAPSSEAGLIAFVVLQSFYWGASGIVLPIVTGMMGDAAHIASARHDEILDGAYSGMFSLVWRVGTSISLLAAGFVLSSLGINASQAVAAATLSTNLAATMFLVGVIGYVAALAWVFFALRPTWSVPSASLQSIAD